MEKLLEHDILKLKQLKRWLRKNTILATRVWPNDNYAAKYLTKAFIRRELKLKTIINGHNKKILNNNSISVCNCITKNNWCRGKIQLKSVLYKASVKSDNHLMPYIDQQVDSLGKLRKQDIILKQKPSQNLQTIYEDSLMKTNKTR